METINISLLKEIIYDCLYNHRNHAILSRIQLVNKLASLGISSRLISVRNRLFRQTLIEVGKELGYKYIIYKYEVRKGIRGGKFYFFNDLNNELALTLLQNRKAIVIKLK